jgi:RHS repeat-associated protein
MKTLLNMIAAVTLLISQVAIADVTYVHSDILGSPVAETNSSGQLVTLSHYKAFGEEIEQKRDDVGYTGHKYDADLGLSYMQARYYDPLIGRFYSNDPIGFTGDITTFNRYSYVGNNPYKYTDPTGESRENKFAPLAKAIAQAVGGKSAAKRMEARMVLASETSSRAEKLAALKTLTGSNTSNAARKESMRQQGIPTSQQPSSQSTNQSGKEFQYQVAKPGGGTETKSVQQQTMDSSHKNEPHWEAGSVKTDPVSGEVRMSDHGRPKLTNEKSKVDYEGQ